MTPLRVASAAVAPILTVALLLGCAPTTNPTQSSSSSSPSSSGSPTPTPVPTVAANDPADPGTWVVDGSGIGPIAIGGPADVSSVLTAFAPDPIEGCRVIFLNGLGLQLAIGPDEAGAAKNVTVHGLLGAQLETPRTSEGIGLGSTEAEVIAAYPTVTPADSLPDAKTYAVPSDGRFVVLVVGNNGGTVSQITVGDSERVPKEFCG